MARLARIRAERAAIVLDAPEVSKHHAWLLVREDGIAIGDRGSTNHTYIGDAEVDQAPWDGALPIRIASFEIHLVAQPASGETRAHVPQDNATRPLPGGPAAAAASASPRRYSRSAACDRHGIDRRAADGRFRTGSFDVGWRRCSAGPCTDHRLR